MANHNLNTGVCEACPQPNVVSSDFITCYNNTDVNCLTAKLNTTSDGVECESCAGTHTLNTFSFQCITTANVKTECSLYTGVDGSEVCTTCDGNKVFLTSCVDSTIAQCTQATLDADGSTKRCTTCEGDLIVIAGGASTDDTCACAANKTKTKNASGDVSAVSTCESNEGSVYHCLTYTAQCDVCDSSPVVYKIEGAICVHDSAANCIEFNTNCIVC